MARLLPRVSGTAAWDSVAASGAKALEVARRAPHTPDEERALGEHERQVATSVSYAHRFEYLLTQRLVPIVLVAGLAGLALLTLLASRAAGHLSRQLSRPLHELVGWTERIRRGEPIPDESSARGAPELRAKIRVGDFGGSHLRTNLHASRHDKNGAADSCKFRDAGSNCRCQRNSLPTDGDQLRGCRSRRFDRIGNQKCIGYRVGFSAGNGKGDNSPTYNNNHTGQHFVRSLRLFTGSSRCPATAGEQLDPL